MPCKTAKSKPLFKKGSKTVHKNYRPISLPTLVSKIIDKVIHDQTESFLDKNNIYRFIQSGFRTFFPLIHVYLSYLNNKTATGFESGLYTGMTLIDFNWLILIEL